MPSNYLDRPATERQVNFIRSLFNERNVDGFDDEQRGLITAFAHSGLTTRTASQLIEALQAAPRIRAAAVPTVDNREPEGELVIRPSYKTRAGRMLQAGGIEATVTMPNGQHVTIRVSSRAPRGRGWANVGPTDEGARTNISVLGRKVGWVNVDAEGAWHVTLRTRNVSIKDAVRVMFEYAAGNTDETGNMGAYRVQESSRCGRCFRQLTDPVSIDRGIGPECYGRTTGSHHVAVERNVTAQTGTLRNANGLMGTAPNTAAPVAPTFRAETIEAARAFGEAAHAVGAAAAPVAQTMSDIARALNTPELPGDDQIQAARDTIVEALDAYESGVTAGMDALRIFDALVAKAQS